MVDESRTVALIPIKGHSERVERKNFQPLGGKPLFEHIIETAIASEVDDVFVNTDSDEVKERAAELGAKIIDRPPHLSEDDANGNDLLLHDAEIVDAGIYVQLFATAPFLSATTVNKALEVLADEAYDSVMTVTSIYSWFWFDGKPVNYDPKVLPRSQDAQPVIRETTGLYAIRKEGLRATRCRIGENPYMLEVDALEAIDIDDRLDLDIAAFLWERHQE